MATDAEMALWAFEEAVEGVLSFVKGASYGLRLAVKRVGDLAVPSPKLPAGKPEAGGEMERLVEALERGEDRLTDLAVLALGDHFRAFLGRALSLPRIPPLPATPTEAESLCGTPEALGKVSAWFPLLLQLYRAALEGGRLDRDTLEALGSNDLELSYPDGKVRLYRAGDHVTLTEGQLEETGRALVEAARAIRLRLLTV